MADSRKRKHDADHDDEDQHPQQQPWFHKQRRLCSSLVAGVRALSNNITQFTKRKAEGNDGERANIKRARTVDPLNYAVLFPKQSRHVGAAADHADARMDCSELEDNGQLPPRSGHETAMCEPWRPGQASFRSRYNVYAS